MKKPFVISFLSTKGGVGKSTITFNLGCLFAKTFHDKKIVFGETDIAQPLKMMFEKFENGKYVYPEILFVGNCNSAADMKSKFASSDADFVFLDGTGTINDAFNQSVIASDFIVWMAGRSKKDIDRLPNNIETAHILNKPGAYLLNGIKKNESVYTICREILTQDPAYNSYPLLENCIRDLSAFRLADVFGAPVVEMDSSSKNAKDDLDNVATEILKMTLKGAEA